MLMRRQETRAIMNYCIRSHFLLACLLSFFSTAMAQIPASSEECQRRTIIVSGESEIKVEPNEVTLTFGIESIDLDLQKAKEQNDTIVKRVLDALKNRQVEPKHIKTDHFSIEPRYEHSYKKRDLIGYVVRKNVIVILHDVKNFELVLSSALEAGANYVHGVQFGTTKLREYRDKARALAIRAAKTKAIALAGELDQKVGKPLAIHEGRGGWQGWYNYGWGRSLAGGFAQNSIQDLSGAAISSAEQTIAPGQLSITANITLTMELL